MKTSNNIISENLKDIRIYLGYSRKEIADILKIARTTYSDYEINRRTIPLKKLNSLSNFYGKSIDYLLGLTSNEKIIIKNELDLKIISSRLKYFRQKEKIKVEDLSKSLNYATSTIYRYESKKLLVSTSFCYDLARKYNVSIDWLLGKIDSKNYKIKY